MSEDERRAAIHSKQVALQFLVRQVYNTLEELHELDPRYWCCSLRDMSGATGASVDVSVGEEPEEDPEVAMQRRQEEMWHTTPDA